MTNNRHLLLAALVFSCSTATGAHASDQTTEASSSPSSTTAAVKAEPAVGAARTSDSTASNTVDSTNPVSSIPINTTPAGNSTSSNPSVQSPAGATATSTSSMSKPVATASPADSPAKPSSSKISEAVPGPYQTDRQKVRNWLLEANKRGVGLTAYIPVWDDMEASVKAGEPDAAVKAKLDKICRNIGDQVKNSSTIQTFRPKKPKPNPDEDVEVIRVKWVGPKGSDPVFRDKADKWYNNAVDLLNPEQRADPLIRRRLHDQRDSIYKEMSSRWKSGEKAWGPRVYKNMNQDMGVGQYRQAESALPGQRFYYDEVPGALPAKNK
jgi:hypothetical protein